MILSVQDIHTYYGNIHALQGLSLDVEKGEIITLIGSNGAGKTTTLNTICGLLTPRLGKVYFQDKDVTGVSAEKLTAQGMALSPEGREIFPELTVQENLRLGAYLQKDKGVVNAHYDRIYSLFPRLKERYKQLAGTLSGGEQQMLAIGRALMSDPTLLLLDEPSLGLAPNLVEFIFQIITDINKQGVTILLVEQNANMALQIADRGYVLSTGTITMTGTGQELLSNSDVQKAYLGQ